MKSFLAVASLLALTACGQKSPSSQVSSDASQPSSSFVRGDKIRCTDAGSIPQTLTIKFTATSPLTAYVRIEGERGHFYPAAAVRIYVDGDNTVFDMSSEDGSYDYLEVPNSLNATESPTLRSDQDDSWVIQCKLEKA